MKFNDYLEIYPTPIISIDQKGFVSGKNYLAEITFPVVHIGAKASRYADFDYYKDNFSRGCFCGKEYPYISFIKEFDGEEHIILVLNINSFERDIVPFNVLNEYKKRVSSLSDKSNKIDSKLKNQQRKYIREIHNNAIKANYFSVFKNLFSSNITFIQLP
jgi:predicted PolB exonuclease-like 3'-5' exonuclease